MKRKRHKSAFARAAIALLLSGLLRSASAAPSDLPVETRIDPAPCFATITSQDDAAIIRVCDSLIDNDKTDRADRLKALLARGAAYRRRDDVDRAIVDYSDALRIDPKLADILNTRGELYRGRGNRPRALADFSAALKLNPQHATARANFKALALELEKIGAELGTKGRPKPPLN